jgi:hypothetical protein
MNMEHWWDDEWLRKIKACGEKPLSTTNPTWFVLGLKPSLHGGKSMTNLLMYGTAI